MHKSFNDKCIRRTKECTVVVGECDDGKGGEGNLKSKNNDKRFRKRRRNRNNLEKLCKI